MSQDEFAHADAAYVLGALEPSERRAYEDHLRRCAACARSVQELAGLPALLSRVDASVLESPTQGPPLSETLLPRLLEEVRRTRRRGTVWGLAGSAAAALIAVAGTTVWLQEGGDSGRQAGPAAVTSDPGAGKLSHEELSVAGGEEMVQVDQDLLHARLVMESVPWGTRLRLACTYTEVDPRYRGATPPSYALVLYTRDGAEQVATWRAVPGRTTVLDAATASDRDTITSVEVRTMTGTPVLVLGS